METPRTFWLFCLFALQAVVESTNHTDSIYNNHINTCEGNTLELPFPFTITNFISIEWIRVYLDKDGHEVSSEKVATRYSGEDLSVLNPRFQAQGKNKNGIIVPKSVSDDSGFYKTDLLKKDGSTNTSGFQVTIGKSPYFANKGLKVTVKKLEDGSFDLTCGQITSEGEPAVLFQWILYPDKTVIQAAVVDRVVTLHLGKDTDVEHGKCSLVPDKKAYTCINKERLSGFTAKFVLRKSGATGLQFTSGIFGRITIVGSFLLVPLITQSWW